MGELKQMPKKLMSVWTWIIWAGALFITFGLGWVPVLGPFMVYAGAFIFLGESKYIGLDVVGWINKILAIYEKSRATVK